MTAGKLFQMAVAECLKARDDRLVRGLVTVNRLRVLDRKLLKYNIWTNAQSCSVSFTNIHYYNYLLVIWLTLVVTTS